MKPQLESSPHLANRINSVRLMEGGGSVRAPCHLSPPALEILSCSHFPHFSSVVTFFRFSISHVTFLDTTSSPHVTLLLPPFPLLQTDRDTKEKPSNVLLGLIRIVLSTVCHLQVWASVECGGRVKRGLFISCLLHDSVNPSFPLPTTTPWYVLLIAQEVLLCLIMSYW